jgi:hypothetical protein
LQAPDPIAQCRSRLWEVDPSLLDTKKSNLYHLNSSHLIKN